MLAGEIDARLKLQKDRLPTSMASLAPERTHNVPFGSAAICRSRRVKSKPLSKPRACQAGHWYIPDMDLGLLISVVGVAVALGGLILVTSNRIHADMRSIRSEMQSMRSEMQSMRSELIERIDAVRSELETKIDAVRSELIERIDAVRSELGRRIDDLSDHSRALEREQGRFQGLLQSQDVLQAKERKEPADQPLATPAGD